MRIALVPAYQPEQLLVSLTERLKQSGFKTVVVDDGSGDQYGQIFSTAGKHAVVLAHEKNKGKGSALKTGLAYIQETFPQNSVVVTLDADGQHKVEDAIRVCEKAEADDNCLVLGCRSLKKMPSRSRFGNTVTRFVFHMSTGVKVGDTQTGLRAFSTKLIPFMLQIEGERYEYEMNMLLECSRNDVPFREVEIETIYFENNAHSHFSTIKDSYRVYRDIFKFAASSFTGFLIDYGLYSLLATLTAGWVIGIPFSNITARIVSASANFAINKHYVFKSKDSVVKTGAQYFILAACIMLCNTALLTLMVNVIGINRYAAKIFTEITFFVFSWTIQRFVIFKKNKRVSETVK
ncbi:MAG TPA: bifunctional glycosyltransferase family 2/GtrA family protein [Oscillospiraceae bacterium]|nr:bifunctional glycosyltransferase family 2/GtrA family protein [Oscillospiraceae bacterium]HPF56006.1 bifunctional glycosyltransferase family 2/GtrA family protein [Clostridiales bacterium]HPK36332.1 bifunctional glycosyltransferase family 2/GtrA family protein [Oscillospiraceae bacterium]HPR76105.1 bifunctional glycosyltransferase family 2/GtrA family protein [Oscillospiraceae bacterium]